MQVSKYGTTLTDNEIQYRRLLIIDMLHCPITSEVLSLYDGEIIYCNGDDYFVSNKGLDKLKEVFGEDFIKERIITYD